MRKLLGSRRRRPSEPPGDTFTVEVAPVEHSLDLRPSVTASTFGDVLVIDVVVESEDVDVHVLLREDWGRPALVGPSPAGVLHRVALPALLLGPSFDIAVYAVAEGLLAEVARVRGRNHYRLAPVASPRSPLFVSGVPRGGTTLMMRLLAEHPDVTCVREYPYESRHAQYWAHALLVMATPANRQHSMTPAHVSEAAITVGSNPFFAKGRDQDEWLATRQAALLAEGTRRVIDEFYDHVAAGQGRAGSTWFAEKFPGEEQLNALRHLYPRAREIFVMRDLRDVVCSAVAMNDRRGRRQFGAAEASTQAEHLDHLVSSTLARWHDYCATWPEAERIVVRYEDLVADALAPLERVCEACGMDAGPPLLAAVVERALADAGLRDRHATSADAASSVGRWRVDLEPEAAAIADELLGELDEAFGYPLGG